jgi:hypothetical protein
MDSEVVRYLCKKSGSDNPAARYQYVLKIADWFKKESQIASKVDRNFIAEVPHELIDFIPDDKEPTDGAYAD